MSPSPQASLNYALLRPIFHEVAGYTAHLIFSNFAIIFADLTILPFFGVMLLSCMVRAGWPPYLIHLTKGNMSPKLGSYLRTVRLKAGLAQKDIAALLGLETGSAISRTEKSNEIPSLAILLGYCVIFKSHPKDLAPRIYRDIEKGVYEQASVLAGRLKKRHVTPALSGRLKFLENLSQSGVRYAPMTYGKSQKDGNS